jgi:hypothetical protein
MKNPLYLIRSLMQRFYFRLSFVLFILIFMGACNIRLSSGSSYNWYYFRKLFYSAELSQEEFIVELPFEYQNGLIFLPVQLNGSDEVYHFIFDTGAEVNIISEKLVEELNLEALYTEFAITDANNQRQQASYYLLDKLNIGGIQLQKTGALSTNWSEVLDCIGIDGIIGANTMEYFVWSFDFKNKTVLITDSRKNVPKERLDKKIKMYQTAKGDMFAEVKINKDVELNAQFDTGCVCFIILQDEDNRRIKDKRLIKRRIQQVTGATSTFADTVSLVAVNSISLDNYDLNHGKELDVRPNINRNYLGNQFLFEHYLTLDTDNALMYLAENEYDWSETGELRLSNIDFGWSGNRVYVAMFTFGSEIEEMGIRYNDRIIKINDTDFTYIPNLCTFIEMREEIKLKDGYLEVTILREGRELFYRIPKEAL